MTAEKYWTKFGMLRSKVARRLFLLFVACALLPVGVLATVSVLDVRAHLNGLSEKRLREGSKSAGMTIVERVSFLEMDLELIALRLPAKSAPTPGTPAPTLKDIVGRRFRNLTVVPVEREAASPAGGGLGEGAPGLTTDERAHVRSGRTLVTTTRRGDGTYAVFVVRLLDPAAPDSDMIVGEVDPAYLWGADGFLSPSTELFVVGQAGETLFSSVPDGVPVGQLREALARGGTTGRFDWTRNDDRYVAGYWTIFMRPSYFASWVLVQSERRSDVELPLREFGWTFSLVVLSTFWVVLIASLNQIRRRMVPVEQLLEATQRLKAGDFSHRVRIASDDEFAAVGAAFNDMTESMGVHLSVMSTINSVGVSLSAEKDEAALLETVLRGAQAVFNADGAAVHLVSKEGRLELALAHVKSLSLWQRGSGAPSEPGPASGSHRDAPALPAVHAATERTISTPDVYAAGADFAALIDFDRRTDYRSRSFVGAPLRNHENEVIGILQLINPMARTTGEIVPFTDEDRQLVNSLASQAAVAVTKNRLVHDFKGLFEGLTELISTAIDEQSPHTGGHVRRVVVLSAMIAEALSRSANRAISDRALTAEELYELRIAALLHDCGKLTTPVQLVDKATKLESVVDRIRLIEIRAEVIRRQYRLELLEGAVQRFARGGVREELADIEARAAEHERQLEADLAMLRRCNRAADFMPDALVNGLQEIRERYSWTNARREKESLVSADEMHHLGVRSGTLTPEERAIVQGHVASTIRMLERLPYPKRLSNVPKYAGAHHEQVNGKGYPLNLAGDDIPIQGRIIAIADRLEALTATDRPYRRAMSLPEAMDVLGQMARAGSVDADLYDVIVSEAIHQRYAEECLRTR